MPALQLDQLAKQAEPAPSKPVEITHEAKAVAQPAETSLPALQPVPKPNVPQLIFLPEKVCTRPSGCVEEVTRPFGTVPGQVIIVRRLARLDWAQPLPQYVMSALHSRSTCILLAS